MKKLLLGNEAIAEGAMKAGMGFYAAYPITPASEIMHHLAKVKDLKFVHAEDEIAAIHMVIGGSLAGKKVMTSTSGPGFSLKQEAIGLAHMAEIPIVIVNVQRVGPSTGMPTRPAQADILQCKYGTHGDVSPIVLCPNSVEECYNFTIEAFNAAEESLSPVVLLTDGYIGHLYESVSLDYETELKERTREPFGRSNRHFTGLVAEEGVPKTKNKRVHKNIIKARKNKIEEVSKNYSYFEYLENNDADTLIIAYGITSRVILPLKEKYSIFRPIRLFPILEELKNIAAKYKKIIVIEMNSGQYQKEVDNLLLRRTYGIHIQGGEISLKEVKDAISRLP